MPSPSTTRPGKYAVKFRLPETDQTRTDHFDTDLLAVGFMERATREGATILECRGPRNRAAA